ncbi:alpha/beta fold hydrolase [Chloroflexota bacterium]
MNTIFLYKSPAGEKEVMALYDAVLARWPVPYETFNIPTRYGNTFMIVSGQVSAPPLFLLHGSCSNAVSWVGEVIEYSRYFRVYAIDILGEPGKSSANRPKWNSPDYAEWQEDLLNALQIQKASFIGISEGGWMALKFATYKPERVEMLVLLTPGGVTSARTSFILRVMLLSILGRRGAMAINRIVFGNQPIHEDAVKFMNAIMTHFKARIGALPLFSDEELRLLTMPILLIAGELDAVIPSNKVAERMTRLVPNVTVKILPEMGHVLYNLAAEITSFLTAKGNDKAIKESISF